MAIQVVLMGLGAIGRLIARAALAKPEVEIVAALDLDPSRVGRTPPAAVSMASRASWRRR